MNMQEYAVEGVHPCGIHPLTYAGIYPRLQLGAQERCLDTSFVMSNMLT